MSIVHGRALRDDFTASADVCIVGSGSGGAVMASVLAASGLSVIVLEEGPHITPEVYGAFRPSESLRHLWRDAGMTTAIGVGDSPLVVLMAGRGVGGSSLLTGGVCFRIPDNVLRDWRELGIDEFTSKSLEPMYESVERIARVQEVPAKMRSKSTQLFVDGANKMGVTMRPLRRNTDGCDGCGRCNFGCPHGAKLSVDRTYLPDALAHGAVIYSDCIAKKIVTKGRRATGVTGRILNGPDGKARGKFTVHAKVVVSACGTLHTPLLLKASGVGRESGEVGKNLTLHPAFRVAAVADRALEGWKGVLQSVYSDHFEPQGLTMVGVYSAANILAAAMPGVGPAHLRGVRDLSKMAVMGGMVHDRAGGTIYRGFGREPIITYKMDPRDKAALVQGIGILVEMAFAGGAKAVHLPIFGSEPITSMEQIRKLLDDPPHGSRIECTAFHPLGSARMGVSQYNSVARTTGECWEVDNLFVADGSLFPTSIGVNSQLPIMTLATRIAWRLRDEWRTHAARAAQ